MRVEEEIAGTLANELANSKWEFGGAEVEYATTNPEGAPREEPEVILLGLSSGDSFTITVEKMSRETPIEVSVDS